MAEQQQHPFVTQQSSGQTTQQPPSQHPVATSNLSIQAQSDEIKYQTKYRELRYKVKAIESDNDRLQVKVLNVKKNIQRLRLERAILYERLISISGANGGPPPNPGPVPGPGLPPPPSNAIVVPPPQVQASYYSQSMPPQPQAHFPNATLPKPPATSSHHHHHHHHHHHRDGHHHHHRRSHPPGSTSAASGAVVGPAAMTGVEYTHSAPPGGERYYSNEPRGPSPGHGQQQVQQPHHHHHNNGQSSNNGSRREYRSSEEVTPGRGVAPPSGVPVSVSPHGGVNMGVLEHGMPPPPPTTTLASSRSMYPNHHREGYGTPGTPSHHGHYHGSRIENGGDEGRWESRRRSDSLRSGDRERDRERDMPMPMPMPGQDHAEDQGEA